MSRMIVVVLITGSLVGCHAPVPSLNMLAPYGSQRVPAPGTGSYGAANGGYYPNPAAGDQSYYPNRYSDPVGAGVSFSDGVGWRAVDATNSNGTIGSVVPASYETAPTPQSDFRSPAERNAGQRCDWTSSATTIPAERSVNRNLHVATTAIAGDNPDDECRQPCCWHDHGSGRVNAYQCRSRQHTFRDRRFQPSNLPGCRRLEVTAAIPTSSQEVRICYR